MAAKLKMGEASFKEKIRIIGISIDKEDHVLIPHLNENAWFDMEHFQYDP